MLLNEEEKAMLNGDMGESRRWATEHMMRVGRFFDARNFVTVSQAHIMADTESLGEAGVEFLEKMAASPPDQRRVRIPMITDPRGIDFCHYKRLKQTDLMANLEQRTIDAFEAMGILMTNTCINYQTIMPPVRGEHHYSGVTKGEMLAAHRRHDSLIIDAGIGHQNTHRLEGIDGTLFQISHQIGLL